MEQEQIKRARRSSAEVRQLLELFSQSGMSAKEFCVLHSISEAGFYKWRSRYSNKPSGGENNFVMLREASAVHDSSVLFAEVKGIRFYQAVSASYLKELIG